MGRQPDSMAGQGIGKCLMQMLLAREE